MRATPSTRSNSRFSQGFSMIELLVAMALMGIIVGQLMLILTMQNRTYAAQERILDTQQDARLVTEMMLADIRMAGFMVPSFTAISSLDGGAAGADVLCVSDPSVLAEAQLVGATTFFDRATVVAPVGAAASTVQLLAASMDIDSDGDGDFAVGGGIIISDGADTHCARIIAVAGNVVTFIPGTPAGFSVAAGAARAVPALIYQVTGAGLSRNAVTLSPHVENLQVEFGVDADGNGQIDAGEFPIHDLAGSDPSQVLTVRLSVIARTLRQDPTIAGSGMSVAANHVGSAPDGFFRRRFTASAAPRNLR